MRVAVGRPKDLQKRERILLAAKQLFLQQGYDGSSMHKIAEMAGVTKLTVYNHFQDKATLFVHAIVHACDQHIIPAELEINKNTNFNKALTYICEQCLYISYLPEALKLEHLMLQLAADNHPLTEKFFNASHRRLNLRVTDFFSHAVQLGFVRPENPQRLTEVLMSQLCGLRFRYVLLGMEPIPDAAERAEIVADAIELFMLKYAA